MSRDKENPKNWYVAKDITLIPPIKEIGSTPLDNIRVRVRAGRGVISAVSPTLVSPYRDLHPAYNHTYHFLSLRRIRICHVQKFFASATGSK